MANNVIGSLLVNLGLETGRLKSDTEKASRHFNSFENKSKRALGGIRKSVSGLVTSIGGLTGVMGTLSVAGFGIMTKNAIDSADKIGKLSDRLGASTEALSQYQHVAELSGVTFETLTMGWQRMTRRIAEAAQGTGEAKNALIELNLSAQDLNQLAPEQQFETIADALSGVTNQADKVRLAMKLFDSGGVSLLQTMNDGADGIRNMRREADDLGLTLSKKDALGAAKANDSITRLTASGRSLGLTLARTLGPALTDTANWLSVNIPQAAAFAMKTFHEFEIGALSLASAIASALGKDVLADSLEQTMNDRIDAVITAATGKLQKFKSSADQSLIVVGSPGKDGNSQSTEQRQKSIDALTLQMQTEEEKIFESYANRQVILQDAWENNLVTDQQYYELLDRVDADYQNKKLAREKSVNDQINGMRASAVSLGIGLLNELGKGHKDWAYASILLEKGVNIAMAIQNTAVAVTKAMAVDPTGALAARAKMIGNIQIGLIAATGIAQAANVGGGISGSPSSPPVPSTPFDPNGGVTTQQSSQIQITIEGNVYSNDDFRMALVDALKTAQANDEVRIINAG